MKSFDKHFDSARRHFGVALIDLNYAAADLARSVACANMEQDAEAAFALLHHEIGRLKELSAFIERMAGADSTQDLDPAKLQRWWPELVRRDASQEQPARD